MATEKYTDSQGDNHLSIAKESLNYLLNDKRVPQQVRESLRDDFQQVEKMLEKIEHEHIHISVLGRVSVGKSSLLNALIGKEEFSTSPLHGETRKNAFANLHEYEEGGVYFIDTPGINEIEGEQRAKMAHEVAGRSDVILFVLDSDITDTEYQALKQVVSESRPVVLVLNKADRYTKSEQKTLLKSLTQRVVTLVDAENIILASSRTTQKHYILVDEQGNETETTKDFPPDIEELKSCLWSIVKNEGKTLAAINAGLFAGDLSDQVSERIMAVRKEVAEKLIHAYCVSKGVAVAINPVPVADLMAAALIDVTLIVHLSRLYGLPLSKSEAGDLIKTIAGQMILLLGTIWGIHFISSALKLGTGGLSTVLTASAQGAVAYYSTLVVGKAAQKYLRQGKSWGEGGAKEAVRSILDSLDRDSILKQAKGDIMTRLKAGM
ncbi:MAG: GTP-binding protein [gamma proteobacterium symbiont of Bathyaustriella thionipta]|nr:GTP-binding protein [gamma proteobacterium symbiont of Bathyaustriella thionipta]MCU7949912.1 GTP-binding protein [gamma proteobacterium symbiont of Bathyaustriella thionipta]MCU7953470.1 GTP-binding protein [gamma proteobacterium symbiont of Bathyaustriella thionipta]MCU7955581.1 GTP-binding protein [gamma proteobacterium symbiont of Bathyaustriella thionipta]MCU7965881.1 GTP-binding protein [gamma proteobacterium symbiont of Bathyaustriella thionipta]